MQPSGGSADDLRDPSGALEPSTEDRKLLFQWAWRGGGTEGGARFKDSSSGEGCAKKE